jgi:hypothetical protein
VISSRASLSPLPFSREKVAGQPAGLLYRPKLPRFGPILPGSAASKRNVDAGVAIAFRHQPQAVKAGDLLFIPALMAADHDGLIPSAILDRRQPHFSSRRFKPKQSSVTSRGSARPPGPPSQTWCASCCSTQTLTSSIRSTRCGSAITVGAPSHSRRLRCPALPVPGATVMMETWAYAP